MITPLASKFIPWTKSQPKSPQRTQSFYPTPSTLHSCVTLGKQLDHSVLQFSPFEELGCLERTKLTGQPWAWGGSSAQCLAHGAHTIH